MNMYEKIKAAMAEAGHVVSEGEHWAAQDAAKFRDFCHFTLGVSSDLAHHILAFPAEFESKVGHLLTEVKEEAEKLAKGAESLVRKPQPVVPGPLKPTTPLTAPPENSQNANVPGANTSPENSQNANTPAADASSENSQNANTTPDAPAPNAPAAPLAPNVFDVTKQ